MKDLEKKRLSKVIAVLLFIGMLIFALILKSCSVPQQTYMDQKININGENLFNPNSNDRLIVGYNRKITKYKVVDYKFHKCPPVRIYDTILPIGETLICLPEFRYARN
jgi:hypothetical protein